MVNNLAQLNRTVLTHTAVFHDARGDVGFPRSFPSDAPIEFLLPISSLELAHKTTYLSNALEYSRMLLFTPKYSCVKGRGSHEKMTCVSKKGFGLGGKKE